MQKLNKKCEIWLLNNQRITVHTISINIYLGSTIVSVSTTMQDIHTTEDIETTSTLPFILIINYHKLLWGFIRIHKTVE